MMDKTYSTAHVSGMTGIPIRTIQDYVKDFRDRFSETARQPSKGRRFTDADIKILHTIRRARHERIPDDDIRKIISGEIDLPLAQEYNEDDIKQMVINASVNLERAIKLMESFEEDIEHMKRANGRMWNDVHTLKEEVNAMKTRMDNFREWQIFMMKNFTDFNPFVDTKDPEQEATRQEAKPEKKQGLIEAFKETFRYS